MAIPVPVLFCVLEILTAPVEVRVAPIVSAVPLRETPTALSALDRLMVPDEVRDRAPVNVSDAVVVMLPAFVTVKLLMWVNEPIANALLPLLNVMLFIAPLELEPLNIQLETLLLPV